MNPAIKFLSFAGEMKESYFKIFSFEGFVDISLANVLDLFFKFLILLAGGAAGGLLHCSVRQQLFELLQKK